MDLKICRFPPAQPLFVIFTVNEQIGKTISSIVHLSSNRIHNELSFRSHNLPFSFQQLHKMLRDALIISKALIKNVFFLLCYLTVHNERVSEILIENAEAVEFEERKISNFLHFHET